MNHRHANWAIDTGVRGAIQRVHKSAFLLDAESGARSQVREAKGAERKECRAPQVEAGGNAKREGNGDKGRVKETRGRWRGQIRGALRYVIIIYHYSRITRISCTYRVRAREACRVRAARARVIWRRQVIDSPSGDNAQPPTSLIVPRDGYRSNSVYFKGDRARSSLEGPLDEGFSVTRTDPRLSADRPG